MEALVTILLAIGALYGAYAGGIKIYKKLHSCTYEEAERNVNYRISDMIMGRPDYYLAGDDIFKLEVVNIVCNILSEVEFKLWQTVAGNVTNIPTNQSGLPAYYILLYVPNEEYRLALELAIGQLAKKTLRCHNCPDYVLLDWAPYCHDNPAVNTNGFEWLYIRYARTCEEQDILRQTHLTERDAMINSQSSPTVYDRDLEGELKQLNIEKEGDHNNVC